MLCKQVLYQAHFERLYQSITVDSAVCLTLQALPIVGARYAAFGDDGCDISVGRYIESGICDSDARWRKLQSLDVRHFLLATLLDRNLISGVERQIERRDRGRDIEGDIILCCQHRDAVCPD